MKSTRFTIRSIPYLFALVTISAYGLLLPLTGFYWDDWPFAWIAKFLGPKEFMPAFAGVRPFLGPIFFVTTSLIPPVPLYWQVFALLIRFIAGLCAWFALNQVWPHHKRQVLVVSLLFLVFPGYSQHWVAFTHINQEWIPFIFYLLSFGFTARALRNHSVTFAPHERAGEQSSLIDSPGIVSPRRHGDASGGLRTVKRPRNYIRNTIYALLFLIAGLFPTEYFIGLEPLRLLFIWVILSEEVKGFWQRVVQTLKHWWPYLLIWLGNAAWLAYFYTLGTYGSYEVEVVQSPLKITQIFSAMGEAVWKAGFFIWVQVLVLGSKAITAPTTLLTLALIIVSLSFFLFFLAKLDLYYGKTKTFAAAAMLIGLAGILLGRVPSLAAGLPLTLQSSYDRFMISMMLGGSLFITGLVELLVRGLPIRKNYVFALLIALAIGQQFFNANIFRRDWAKQQEIYWQLAWRIPALEPGTALLTDQLPIDYETDLSFTAPINWMYAPDYEGGNLPYALIYTEKRLGRAALASLETNTEINLDLRRVVFRGSTSQAIVIHMPKNGCLRVLDPARGDEITYARESRFLVNAMPLSDPSRIIDVDQTAKLPFLPEPKHTWCYYYAKAELAYQQGDWNQVAGLINEAKSLGYQPEDPFEWLTFIEAQAVMGNFDDAKKISTEVFAEDKRSRQGLCQLWKRVQDERPARNETAALITELLFEFQCAR